MIFTLPTVQVNTPEYFLFVVPIDEDTVARVYQFLHQVGILLKLNPKDGLHHIKTSIFITVGSLKSQLSIAVFLPLPNDTAREPIVQEGIFVLESIDHIREVSR
jgi:hypothetical protein